MKQVILILSTVLLVGAMVFLVWNHDQPVSLMNGVIVRPTVTPTLIPSPSVVPTVALPTPPAQVYLDTNYHIFQSFNNCGPASLSMALSYYNIEKSQEVLGELLRPYQNPQGDNDDKSVTLEELARQGEKEGLLSYHRPNGSLSLLRQILSAGYPVITRTWLKPGEDIGHYRVVKGYDSARGILIQDDSLQGKNLEYTEELFRELWKPFSYEYLVMVPPDKRLVVERILGDQVHEDVAWRQTLTMLQEELKQQPDDTLTLFNLSVAAYHTGDYQLSIDAYEQVATRLPFRTLWYQIEPIQSYQKVKRYDTIFALTDRILTYHNRAFSELYQIRGEIYREQGKHEEARIEFEKAVFYNRHFLPAQEALSSL